MQGLLLGWKCPDFPASFGPPTANAAPAEPASIMVAVRAAATSAITRFLITYHLLPPFSYHIAQPSTVGRPTHCLLV